MSNQTPYHYPRSEYNLAHGDRVYLIATPNKRGNLLYLDTTKPHPTNCTVLWDDRTTSELTTQQIAPMEN